MSFADPAVLLLLLLIPPLFLLRKGRAALGYPDAGRLAGGRTSPMLRLHWLLPWWRALLLVCLVLALARPQWGSEVTRTRREGIAIAMVIDISSSMSAVDLQLGDRPGSRLEVVKATFHDFVVGRGDLSGQRADAIGMITFARHPTVVIPPTTDHEALLQALARVAIVDRPIEDGTGLGDALLRAVAMLRKVPGASRVIILLTDGSNNVGEAEPLVAARIAAAFGIRVHTIGAGSNGIAAMPVTSASGETVFRQSAVSIDLDMLSDIARLTEARSFQASDAAALRAIYAEIDGMEKSYNVVETQQVRHEAFPLLVGAALLMLAVEIGLVTTRLQTFP